VTALATNAVKEKLIALLLRYGVELPGAVEEWSIDRPPNLWGRSRRNKSDMEEGTLSWYLIYSGKDEAAKEWSNWIGGEESPNKCANTTSTLEKVYDYSGRYKRESGLKIVPLGYGEDEDGPEKPARRQRYFVYKCEKCGHEFQKGRRYKHEMEHASDQGRLVYDREFVV